MSLPMLCYITFHITILDWKQNNLLENGKDGNDMIFFCLYIVPLAEFETPSNDKFTVYREIKIKRKLQPDLIFLW